MIQVQCIYQVLLLDLVELQIVMNSKAVHDARKLMYRRHQRHPSLFELTILNTGVQSNVPSSAGELARPV